MAPKKRPPAGFFEFVLGVAFVAAVVAILGAPHVF